MADDDDAILVCVPPEMSWFTDNLSGVCSSCGRAIVWRPHAPILRRVCIFCARSLMALPGSIVTATPEAIREAAERLAVELATIGTKAS